MGKKRYARQDYMGLAPVRCFPASAEHIESSEAVRNEVNLWIENHELFRRAIVQPKRRMQTFLMALHLSGMRWQFNRKGDRLFYCRQQYSREVLNTYVNEQGRV